MRGNHGLVVIPEGGGGSLVQKLVEKTRKLQPFVSAFIQCLFLLFFSVLAMSLRRTVLISIAVLLGTVAADTTYGADTLMARSSVL